LAPSYRSPAIDSKRMLRLSGAFRLRPTAVLFDLTFQWVSNRWRPFGVSLGGRSISSGCAQARRPPRRHQRRSKKYCPAAAPAGHFREYCLI